MYCKICTYSLIISTTKMVKDVIKQQQQPRPPHSPPVCSVCYSRCTELMRSLYLLRSSLLRSGLSSSAGTNRGPPSSPSLGCSSAVLWPAEPFCRGVSSSQAALLLFMFSSWADGWRQKILYAHACCYWLARTTITAKVMLSRLPSLPETLTVSC